MNQMRIGWYLHKHIILIQLQGEINYERLQRGESFILSDLLSNTRHPLHLIIDGSGVTHLPTLSQLQGLRLSDHPLLGWVLLVGWHQGVRTALAQQVLQALSTHARIVHSLREGTQFLQSQDPNLPTPGVDNTIVWLYNDR